MAWPRSVAESHTTARAGGAEEMPAPGLGMCCHLGCSPCTAGTLVVPSCCTQTQANRSQQSWELVSITNHPQQELVPPLAALEKSRISFLAAVADGHSQDNRDRPITLTLIVFSCEHFVSLKVFHL